MPRISQIFSNILLPKSTRTSHNVLDPSLRPSLRPSTRSFPTLDIFSKTLLTPLIMSPTRGSCINASIHFLTALVQDSMVFLILSKVNTFLNFFIVFWTAGNFENSLNHFEIAEITLTIMSTVLLNTFANKLCSCIQSLNLTITSPIDAVISNMSISKASRTFDIILNAVLKPPPIIVVIISRMANTPLKVRCIFLPVSLSSPVSLSVSLSFSENLFKDLTKL